MWAASTAVALFGSLINRWYLRCGILKTTSMANRVKQVYLERQTKR